MGHGTKTKEEKRSKLFILKMFVLPYKRRKVLRDPMDLS